MSLLQTLNQIANIDLEIDPFFLHTCLGQVRPQHSKMLAPLGQPIPDTAHAVSVSLPSWQSNVGYEEGEDWVMSKMRTGYPRFFIHLVIQELEQEILSRYGETDQRVMLFPSRATASRCQRFLLDKEHSLSSKDVCIASLVPTALPHAGSAQGQHVLPSLFGVLFPSQYFNLAKQVWQHSGDGISSRRGEFCLKALREGLLHREGDKALLEDPLVRSCKGPRRYRNAASNDQKNVCEGKDYSQFVEERFGRNLNANLTAKAKLAIRRRISGCLKEDVELDKALETSQDTPRRISGLSEEDIYLYPSGMSSIFNTHSILMANRAESCKSICFGFPYIDTLKILEKWGPGCLFYGNGSDADLDDLESRLKQGQRYLALFTEAPSNPLLNTPNLKRIRWLADHYDFAVVVDETIGNFLNLNTLSLADVVVSSLTKIFSGDSNVMGGSAVYNPHGPRYSSLRQTLDVLYEDNYWAEDAVFMERNSRDFMSRIERVNANAEAIADLLHSSPVIKELYYPKHRPSRTCYDQLRNPNGGYGGLLSVTFRHAEEAALFFDALEVQKGPSLGTNFTLASPFVILAHYNELDWAARFGVDARLVRISVGLECCVALKAVFERALAAVERLGLGGTSKARSQPDLQINFPDPLSPNGTTR